MGKLVRMDLYRMFRSKSFFVCLILSFLLAFGVAPLEKLLSSLSELINTETKTEEKISLDDITKRMMNLSEDEQAKIESIFTKYGLDDLPEDEPFTEESLKARGIDVDAFSKEIADVLGLESAEKNDSVFQKDTTIENMLKDPFLLFGAMLVMLSVCSFYYADVENGYIKNIAGQMPKKGYTILSKYTASVAHNLIFMAVGVLGNLLGCLLVKNISSGDLLNGIGVFILKLMLLQSICAMLVLFVSTLQNKSLGTVIAVLMGLGLLSLIYSLIDTQGIQRLFPDAGDVFGKYMPDVLLGEKSPDAVTAIVVSILFGGLFLTLAIRLFDKRDVK